MLTQTYKNWNFLPVLLIIMVFSLSGCAVYTVDKSQLETKLKPGSGVTVQKGLGLNQLIAMYRKRYNNRVDTLFCVDKVGKVKTKRLSCDSKVTVITTNKKSINFYAKTLYIWKDEFLIGELTTISLRKSNYFSVKLKDIARIEVKG